MGVKGQDEREQMWRDGEGMMKPMTVPCPSWRARVDVEARVRHTCNAEWKRTAAAARWAARCASANAWYQCTRPRDREGGEVRVREVRVREMRIRVK